MANQKEIAKLAQVSQMTVSLSLRDSPEIPEATKLRVLAVAKQLNYRPNPLVSALMRHRRRKGGGEVLTKIAFLHDNPEDPSTWVSAHYSTGCFAGAQQVAQERGYVFEAIYVNSSKLSGKRLSQILWTQNVQGLLVAPMPIGVALDCDWGQFAAVSLDYSHALLNVHRVIDDHSAGMSKIVSQICKRNYRRPGLVMRESGDNRTNHNRLGSFLAHCSRNASLSAIPAFFFEREAWDEDKFLQWIREYEPDVIITGDHQVVAALEKNAHASPAKIGIALYFKGPRTLKYSGLSVDSFSVGQVAARHLISMIENNQRGLPEKPTTTYVDASRWDDGESLRSIP